MATETASSRSLPPGWPRSYTIVGVGAIGGYYGGLLAASGRQVRFVARSDADHLREHGLRVDSPAGDLVLDDVEVHTPEAAGSIPPSDVVVLSTKTTANSSAIDLLDAIVDDATTLVVLQNGLGVEEQFQERLGVPVVGGMCFICSTKAGPGHVRHLDYGAVTIGESAPGGLASGRTERLERLGAGLAAAGINVTIADDLGEARWRKLVWNVPFNGLSVVLDAGTDALMSDPSTRRLIDELMHEVRSGAIACGHGFVEEFIAKMLVDTEAMEPYAPSMKADYDAGRPLELDAIYRAPIDAAGANGQPMPRVEMLWEQLSFMDHRNR